VTVRFSDHDDVIAILSLISPCAGAKVGITPYRAYTSLVRRGPYLCTTNQSRRLLWEHDTPDDGSAGPGELPWIVKRTDIRSSARQGLPRPRRGARGRRLHWSESAFRRI